MAFIDESAILEAGRGCTYFSQVIAVKARVLYLFQQSSAPRQFYDPTLRRMRTPCRDRKGLPPSWRFGRVPLSRPEFPDIFSSNGNETTQLVKDTHPRKCRDKNKWPTNRPANSEDFCSSQQKRTVVTAAFSGGLLLS